MYFALMYVELVTTWNSARLTRRLAWLPGLLLIATTACDSPAGPPEQLEGAWYASSVNGHAVPLRSFEWLSNDAGTCERDLDGADLFFNGQNEFSLFVHYTLRCQDSLPRRPHTELQGLYARDDDELELHPFSMATDSIRDAGFSGGDVFIVIRRNEQDYRLVFKQQG